MYTFEKLEPRILLSADLLPIVTDTQTIETFDNSALHTSILENSEVQLLTETTSTPPQEDISLTVEATEQPTEIIFINDDVEDSDALLADINNQEGQKQAFVLDSSVDGIQQITNILAANDSIDAIHFISHGTDGNVKLGNTWLNFDNTTTYTESISSWGDSLSVDGDILFYGCDLASAPDGLKLIDEISSLTSADVAASTDSTGHQTLAADWVLEYQLGEIEAKTPLSQELQNSWVHVLAEETVSDNFNTGLYDNNTGTQPWVGDWVEIGDGATGPASGNVSIDSVTGSLRLITADIGESERGISRVVDLSNTDSAFLSFDYVKSLLNPGDPSDLGHVTVMIRHDNTETWATIIGSYSIDADTSGSALIDISDYNSATTEIKFTSTGQGPGDFSAGIDEFFIDNVRIDYTTSSLTAPLWLTTDRGVSSGGQQGTDSWDKADFIGVNNPDLSFGTSTSGTFSIAAHMSSFTAGKDISALHYVSRDIQIGTAAFQLLEGDILFASPDATNEDFGNNNVQKEDIVLFRPTTKGDYSTGSFQILFDDFTGGGDEIRGITLIEQDVTVGGKNLSAGDLLFVRSGGAEDQSVWLYETDNVTLGNGTISVLLDGHDAGVDIGERLTGIDLVEETITIGGKTLNSGTILLSVDNTDTIDSITIRKSDIFALEVTSVSDPTDPTVGMTTASIFFDGSDVSFDNENDKIDGFSLTVGPIQATNTITSGTFDAENRTITLSGTDFTFLGNMGDDVRANLDWSKFVWDVNGDDGVTTNITFSSLNVSTAIVTDATTLTLHLTGQKTNAIVATPGYGDTGGRDTLDIATGFSSDGAGSFSTTDGLSDGPLLLAPNSAPTATNLTLSEPYTEDTIKNLTAIVISDVDYGSLYTVTFTLSDISAGSFNTNSFGTANSTFSSGVLTVSGTGLADVNTLLSSVIFTPSPNYNSDFTIATSVTDGFAVPLTGTRTMTATPVNDPPVIAGDSTGSVTEDVDPDSDTWLETAGVLVVTDPDVGESNFVAGTVTGTYGELIIDSVGNWSYIADNTQTAIQELDVGENLTDTLSVLTTDDTTHIITITINGAEDAPTLDNPVGDKTATENTAFSFTFAANTFNDRDASDTLTYTATQDDDSPLPLWLNFDSATRTFSGTPSILDFGTFRVKLTTTDGTSSVSDIFAINVDTLFHAPIITGTDTGTVTEDIDPDSDTRLETAGVLFIADPDVGEASFIAETVSGSYGELTIDSIGNWSYSADNLEAAIQQLDVAESLTDLLTITSADNSTHQITITIHGAEDTPTLDNPIANQTAIEDAAFSFTFAANTFSDVDASDTFSYSATLADDSALPAWLIFNPVTRTFSGTPVNSDVGSFNVKVTADDTTSTATNIFTITVANTDDPPIITGIDTGAVTEDVDPDTDTLLETVGVLTISDPDLGESSFVAETINGSYGKLTIDSGGSWSYSADNTQAVIQQLDATESHTDTFTITTADGTTHTVTITINGAEDTPTLISAIPNRTAIEDTPFIFTIAANTFSDVDSSDSLNYSATLGDDSDLPTWLNFDPATRTFSGTPNNAGVGTINVKVTVSDGTSTISDIFILTVNNTPDSPIIGGLATGSVTEDVDPDADSLLEISGVLTVSDPDLGESSFVAETVAGTYGALTIDTAGSWFYEADNTQIAIQQLGATATLTETLTVATADGTSKTVTITITGTDDAAVASGTTTGSVTEGNIGDALVTATGTISISDLDADDSPSFADVSTAGDNDFGSFVLTSGTWTYTLDQTKVQGLDAGDTVTDAITYTATDGTTQTITITITGTDDLPLVSGTTTGSVTEGNIGDALVTATGTISISDLDADDSPIFADVSTADDNDFGSFVLTSGTWTYTLDQTKVQDLDAGDTVTDAITYTATDGTSQTVTITIAGTEDGPTMDNAIGDQTTTEDTTFSFNIPENSFSDVDISDTLSYTATLDDDSDLPAWLSFDPTSLIFSGTPTNDDIGTISVKVSADDGTSTIADIFTLTVNKTQAESPSNNLANTPDLSLPEKVVTTVPIPTDETVPADEEPDSSTSLGPLQQSSYTNSTDGTGLPAQTESLNLDISFRNLVVSSFSQKLVQHSPTENSLFDVNDYNLLNIDYQPRTALEYDTLRNSLDAFREEAEHEAVIGRTVVGSAIAASTGLSAGYVVWMLRSGALLSSLLSSLPAWQLADPLAILVGSRKRSDEDDDDSIEAMIANSPENIVKTDTKPEEPTTEIQANGISEKDVPK